MPPAGQVLSWAVLPEHVWSDAAALSNVVNVYICYLLTFSLELAAFCGAVYSSRPAASARRAAGR